MFFIFSSFIKSTSYSKMILTHPYVCTVCTLYFGLNNYQISGFFFFIQLLIARLKTRNLALMQPAKSPVNKGIK